MVYLSKANILKSNLNIVAIVFIFYSSNAFGMFKNGWYQNILCLA